MCDMTHSNMPQPLVSILKRHFYSQYIVISSIVKCIYVYTSVRHDLFIYTAATSKHSKTSLP